MDIELNLVIQSQTTFTGNFNVMYGPTGLTGSGSGSVDNTFSGNTVSIEIDPGSPITVSFPDGPPDSISNGCRYSIEGPVEVEASGPKGLYKAIWNFFSNSSTVAVSDRTYYDMDTNEQEPLSDSSFTAGTCGGSIDDWVGTYVVNWECDPPESGSSTVTITVTGPNTVHIHDVDVDTGAESDFDATTDPGNPHVIHGSFYEGSYREDFTWTLNEESNLYNKRAVWYYVSGPDLGTGGNCTGRAVKQ